MATRTCFEANGWNVVSLPPPLKYVAALYSMFFFLRHAGGRHIVRGYWDRAAVDHLKRNRPPLHPETATERPSGTPIIVVALPPPRFVDAPGAPVASSRAARVAHPAPARDLTLPHQLHSARADAIQSGHEARRVPA